MGSTKRIFLTGDKFLKPWSDRKMESAQFEKKCARLAGPLFFLQSYILSISRHKYMLPLLLLFRFPLALPLVKLPLAVLRILGTERVRS